MSPNQGFNRTRGNFRAGKAGLAAGARRLTQTLADMKHLDQQLAAFRDRLCGEVGLTSEEAGKVATLVAADIRFLPPESKAEIKAASPVPLSARLDELVAFQMGLSGSRNKIPDDACLI